MGAPIKFLLWMWEYQAIMILSVCGRNWPIIYIEQVAYTSHSATLLSQTSI